MNPYPDNIPTVDGRGLSADKVCELILSVLTPPRSLVSASPNGELYVSDLDAAAPPIIVTVDVDIADQVRNDPALPWTRVIVLSDENPRS